MRTLLREILIIIIVAVGIFFLLQTTVQSFIVVGASMKPTFEQGQRLLVNKAVYRFREPQRGDVIVFHPPHNQRDDYVKRIIAIPSDTVKIEQGVVYVNGSELTEPYINTANPATYSLSQQTIRVNNYFVLGDNRRNSNDSHNGWTVKDRDLIGKAWLSIWPPNQWGVVAHYPLQEQLPSTELFPQLPQAEMNHGWSTMGASVGNSRLLQLSD